MTATVEKLVDKKVELAGEELLRTKLAEPGATLTIRKVTHTGYRVNWSKPVQTGLVGLTPLRIYRSAFVTLDGETITFAARQ